MILLSNYAAQEENYACEVHCCARSVSFPSACEEDAGIILKTNLARIAPRWANDVDRVLQVSIGRFYIFSLESGALAGCNWMLLALLTLILVATWCLSVPRTFAERHYPMILHGLMLSYSWQDW